MNLAYDTSTEPSIFAGSLGDSIKETFRTMGRRFTFGGDTGKDQRVYYFNTKEIMDNKFGTANPFMFDVVNKELGMRRTVQVRCKVFIHIRLLTRSVSTQRFVVMYSRNLRERRSIINLKQNLSMLCSLLLQHFPRCSFDRHRFRHIRKSLRMR